MTLLKPWKRRDGGSQAAWLWALSGFIGKLGRIRTSSEKLKSGLSEKEKGCLPSILDVALSGVAAVVTTLL